MKALENDLVAYTDVDETLVTMFEPAPPEGVILYRTSAFDLEFTTPRGVKLWANSTLCEKLRQHKRRGHAVVVWSAGGHAWAQEVVKAIEMEEYVDLCLSKPRYCYDDKDPADFIPKPTRPDEK